MGKDKMMIFVMCSLFLIILFIDLNLALPLNFCTPDSCPAGYQQTDVSCNNGKCYVTCNYYTGCETNYTTIYNDSEYLPNLDIPSYSGASRRKFQLAHFAPTDTTKCYRFRQTTPNNFISNSDIDQYSTLSNFDSGISLSWIDNNDTKWYDNLKYYSVGDQSRFLTASEGGVWIDSCMDDGNNFNSADSFANTNYAFCAPTQNACDSFNETSCDIDCYGATIELELALIANGIKDGSQCNNFNDFDDTGSGSLAAEIDFVNFDAQTVYMYVDEYDAILNHSFNHTCDYWPKCNPADPCCNINGNLRASGYVCRSAHNAVCDSSNTTGCDGHAYEDRCNGVSSLCPDNNYEIDYDDVCTGVVCLGQSCSGYSLQPERTCSSNICQTNNPYDCPNNLNCLDSTSCKSDANSSVDCRTGYTYESQQDVCWLDNNGTAYNLIYDKNGNLITGFGINYTYDGFNQLRNVLDSTTGETIAEYLYDDEGIRIKSVVYEGTENTTTYYFDNFVQIVNSSGVYNETYYYYYEKIIGKKDINGNILFYHPNALTSVDVITNSSGDVVEDLDYEPFGELLENTDERYTFTGHELDSETGLLYMKARYQDPDLAKFIQPDPVLQDVYNPQDFNKYAYARNNPYRYVDKSGNTIWDVVDVGFFALDLKAAIQNPSLKTIGWATLSTVSLFPLLPNVAGYVRYGAKTVDLSKNFKRTDEAILSGKLILKPGERLVGKIKEIELPKEARETLSQIKKLPESSRSELKGFFNEFKDLPRRESGYYKKVDVKTPGVSDRGQRRIILGRSGETYYTQTHYKSFWRVIWEKIKF